MHINYPKEVTPPKALEGLKVVEDFKYLGARKAFVNKEEFLGVSFGNYKPFADLIAYPDTWSLDFLAHLSSPYFYMAKNPGHSLQESVELICC